MLKPASSGASVQRLLLEEVPPGPRGAGQAGQRREGGAGGRRGAAGRREQPALCGGRAHPDPGGDPFGGIVRCQVRQPDRRRPKQERFVCSGLAGGPRLELFSFLKIFFLLGASFFLSAQTCVPRTHLSRGRFPLAGARGGAGGTEASGSGLVPALPLLAGQAFVPRVSPSSFVTRDASASRPK